MQITGIIAEYNPLHSGHVSLMDQIRARLGTDTAILCVMSGDFVQRGDFSVVGRRARARAAVESGADLVVELPLPWATASAEGFAWGAVSLLHACGIVDHLAFGSECGDGPLLERLAAALEDQRFSSLLQKHLTAGDSFAAARQRSLAELIGPEDAAALSLPNNTLGVEYCRALLRLGSPIRPLTIPRTGTAHASTQAEPGAHPSATAIRTLLESGQRQTALSLMAPAMARAYEAEEAQGRAPVFSRTCERAILARLRTMDRETFAALDTGREGLCNRLYAASRTAATLSQLLDLAKTRRYPMARLRRMVLWAYLGLGPVEPLSQPSYLRPLAANSRGRALLSRMQKEASLPVLTKPADVRVLSARAQALFSAEARSADLYSLAYPDLSAAKGGRLWREGPLMLP